MFQGSHGLGTVTRQTFIGAISTPLNGEIMHVCHLFREHGENYFDSPPSKGTITKYTLSSMPKR
jgi:hypothetical protein